MDDTYALLDPESTLMWFYLIDNLGFQGLVLLGKSQMWKKDQLLLYLGWGPLE